MALPLVPLWLDRVKALALDAVSSPHSRRAYDRALSGFLTWYTGEGAPGFCKATVQRYRTHLEASGLAAASVNVALSAIRKLAQEAADNGWLAPELAAGVARVRGVRNLGVRAGNWLTPAEATSLLNAPGTVSVKAVRDRAILALLIGCGLRRSEVVHLNVGDLQLRDSRWVIPDLQGKGNRLRTVAVPVWVKILLDQWTALAAITDGPLFRPLNKAGAILAGRLDEDSIWVVVRATGARIGHPALAPHDLRRTCAKLCRGAGGELEQIQLLLGHASVQTTERYLGSRQNLAQAVNDHLPVDPELGKGLIFESRNG